MRKPRFMSRFGSALTSQSASSARRETREYIQKRLPGRDRATAVAILLRRDAVMPSS
jgi:hypothetical protein